MRLVAFAVLVLISAVGCGNGMPAPTAAPGPAGGNPEQRALMGGEPCRSDADCLTGLCAEGTCIGFLMVSSDAGRDVVGAAVKKALGDDPVRTARLASMARDMAIDDLTEVYFRSRATDFFRFLPCEHTIKMLPPMLSSPDEPVRFFSARALSICGDAGGRKAVEEFRNHGSEAVRRLAGACQ